MQVLSLANFMLKQLNTYKFKYTKGITVVSQLTGSRLDGKKNREQNCLLQLLNLSILTSSTQYVPVSCILRTPASTLYV